MLCTVSLELGMGNQDCDDSSGCHLRTGGWGKAPFWKWLLQQDLRKRVGMFWGQGISGFESGEEGRASEWIGGA